jgi:predicted transposase/invertase (TIGR01784 family)
MGQHDLSYRLFFKHRSMIQDLLIEIVGAPWVNNLDLAAAELVDGSLIADSHENRESDVLWRIPRKGNIGPDIYILLELQSRPDPTMPVRLMGYKGLLYQRLLANKIVSIRNKLPLVIPILLYNGLGPWNEATDLGSLIGDLDASEEIYRPQLRFLLVDERRFPAERLATLSGPVAALFRIEKSRDWSEVLRNVHRIRQDVTEPSLRRAFETWLQKVILPRFGVTAEASAQLTLEEMETMLAESIDQWNRQIREEGIQVGRQEGRQEGRREGEARVLLRQLGLKFGPLSPEIEERVRAADSERLLEWSERILAAERLEDVLGA